MKDSPILCSVEMVEAIGSGRKTQTRRVVKPQPTEYGLRWATACGGDFAAWQDPGLMLDEHSEAGGPCQRKCPYGRVGDRLWVRESHRLTKYEQNGEEWVKVDYRVEVDGDCAVRHFRWEDIPRKQRDRLARIKTWGKWRPARFMYRFLARIALGITEIRVESLHKISVADCVVEGYPLGPMDDSLNLKQLEIGIASRRGWYRTLWDALNAQRGYPWESNPFCWVISFQKVE